MEATFIAPTTERTISAAEQKLQLIIDRGKSMATNTMATIFNECEYRKDYIVKPSSIGYEFEDGNLSLEVRNGSEHRFGLTDHARGSLYSRIQVPKTFADKLLGFGEDVRLKGLMRAMTEHTNPDGMMIRSIGNMAKGILSPAYKRIDARELFAGYITACTNAGLVPVHSRNTDYRFTLTFIKPQVYVPAANEAIIYGVNLTTGDYGNQRVILEMVAMRIWCTNLMIANDVLSRTHVGRRFNTEEEFIELSERTLELDERTMASALNDGVNSALGKFKDLDEVIGNANEEQPNVKYIMEKMSKRFNKDLAKVAEGIYNSESDLYELPTVPSKWRMSNVMSLMAHDKALSQDVRHDLNRFAFEVIQ